MSKLYLVLLICVFCFVSCSSAGCQCGCKASLQRRCRPFCPPHERFILCGSFCQETCDTIGQNCTRQGVTCENRCYCKKGYVRKCNESDKCIRKEECQNRKCPVTQTSVSPSPTTVCDNTTTGAPSRVLNCTRPHEHYECGSACQTTCKDLGKPCSIINVRCNDTCYCDKGYARNSHGTCIEESKCEDEKSSEE